MDATQPYAERLAAARQRIEDVYHHRHNGVLPFVIGDVNYWLSGETPALIPGDYFTRPGSMLEYQTGKIRRHLARFADDYVPLLFPWYGTGVLASGFGSQIVFPEKMDPAVRGAVLSRPEDVGKLGEPDPHKDGLMPRVLETIRYFRAHSDLPISFTDPQGPFTTALTLAGPERLFLWLYEYPQAVHELMDRSTEAFIRWIKAQKEEIGDRSGGGCYPHGIVLPERFGGMWLCDDDCGAISAEHYRQFVVPYLSRIFRALWRRNDALLRHGRAAARKLPPHRRTGGHQQLLHGQLPANLPHAGIVPRSVGAEGLRFHAFEDSSLLHRTVSRPETPRYDPGNLHRPGDGPQRRQV